MVCRSAAALMLLAAPSGVFAGTAADAPATTPLSPLEALLAISKVPEPEAPPAYNCFVEYDDGAWRTLWSPDWKEWCCTNENRGCEEKLSLKERSQKKREERREKRELEKQREEIEADLKKVLGKFGGKILEEHDKAVAEEIKGDAEPKSEEHEKAGQKKPWARPKKPEAEAKPKAEEPKAEQKKPWARPKKPEAESKPKAEEPKHRPWPKKQEDAAQQKFLSGPVRALPGHTASAGSWALGTFVLGSAVVGFSALLVSALRRSTHQRFERLTAEGLEGALKGDSLEARLE